MSLYCMVALKCVTEYPENKKLSNFLGELSGVLTLLLGSVSPGRMHADQPGCQL